MLPFVRDWTSLLQRHLQVDSRLLSQSFERSAPSLAESVSDAHVPVLPQGRQRWKAALPPFVRDWTSLLLQRHLRVNSRLLSQLFKRSAPSLAESVSDAHVPVLPQGRQRWKAGKQKQMSSRIVETSAGIAACSRAEFAIIAAARLVVMNLVTSNKHGLVGCCEFVAEAQKALLFIALCSPVRIQVTMRN